MLARYMLSLCVRLSVRPSQVGCFTKTAKPKITQTTPYDRDSSFLMPKISEKFQTGHPQQDGDAKQR